MHLGLGLCESHSQRNKYRTNLGLLYFRDNINGNVKLTCGKGELAIITHFLIRNDKTKQRTTSDQ